MLMGSVNYVTTSEIAEILQLILPCKASPSLIQVIRHLVNAVQSYCSAEKALYMSMMAHIYSYLKDRNTRDVKCALEDKKLERWVWNGEGFSDPIPGRINAARKCKEASFPEERRKVRILEFSKAGFGKSCLQRHVGIPLQEIKKRQKCQITTKPTNHNKFYHDGENQGERSKTKKQLVEDRLAKLTDIGVG